MNLTINVKNTDFATSAKNPLTVATGGIQIGLISNPSPANTFTQAVTNGTAIDISVTQTGYHPYSMTIDNVYSADKTIDIVLQEITTLASNVAWRFDDNAFISDSVSFISFVSTNKHSFVVGDEVTIEQDPGFTNASYNGPTTVTQIVSDYEVKVAKSFGVSTPPEGGQIVKTNVHPYANIYPDMFHFLDMCSFKADYYSANSGDISESSWYVNNILYATGTKTKIDFIYPGDYQVKHVVENAEWLKAFATTLQGNTVLNKTKQPIGNYLVLDTTTNVTIAEYRPDLSLGFTTPNKPLASTDLSCYAMGETITITPAWTLNRPGAVENDHKIVYTITDPDGFDVDPTNVDGEVQDTFPLSTGFVNATVTFSLDKLGTYKVKATIEDDDCGTEFPIEYCVETCKFINIKYKSCNVFTIENKSSVTDVTYNIDQWDVGTSLSSGTLAAGSSMDITFKNPGLFIVKVTYGSTVEKYIISNHCEVEKCITSYITDLLCGGGDPCSPCPEDNELNQILLMSYTYFMKLNKEYALNNFYTGISNEKADELTSISGVLNKMSLFCSRRKCLDSSFSEGTNTNGPVNNWSSSNGDCGCNSTNTASTNVNTSSSGCGCS